MKRPCPAGPFLVRAAVAVLALAAPAAAKEYTVERTRDIDYAEIKDDPDAAAHRLDVFRPVGRAESPVVVFVHGGAWTIGDKDDGCGVYGHGNMAEALARRGLVVVLPNYRLSPKARHPAHVTDVARAVAWTLRHVQDYSGRPDQVFLLGHSAGGHLVALLATDETYLKAEGFSSKDLKGVVGVSGIYKVDGFDMKWAMKSGWMDCNADVHPFASAFGDDPDVIKDASPLTHVRPGLPPFLLIYGGLDYGPIQQATKDFGAAVKEKGGEAEVKKLTWCIHETTVLDFAHGIQPATADAVMNFIARCTDASAVANAIQDAGGQVTVDDKQPDKPVVTVILWGPGFKPEMLKDMKEFKSLQRLRIGGPWITDEALKPLKELKGLQKLEVRSPHVTDAGLKEIQDALPDCKIRRAAPGDDK
jgi:acetyl esterase/lipase